MQNELKTLQPVIVNCVRFSHSKNKTWNYYKSGKYIKYITREEALCKLNFSEEELKTLCNLHPDLYKLEVKKISELSKKSSNSGVWDKDGMKSQKEFEVIDKKIKNLNKEQIIWDYVISLDEIFANKNKIFTPQQIHSAVVNNFEKFIRGTHLADPKNIEWWFTMHDNTDNPHIHFGFFEKNPQHFNQKKNKMEFSKIGAIDHTEFKKFGFRIASSIKNDTEWKKINFIRNNFIQDFKHNWANIKSIYGDLKSEENADVMQKINSLVFNLKKMLKGKKVNNLYYGKLNENVKNQVDDLSSALIDRDNQLKNKFEEYLFLLQSASTKFDKMGNVNNNKLVNDFKNNRLAELRSRLGNSILKELERYIDNNPRIKSNNNSLKTIMMKEYDTSLFRNTYKIINKLTFALNAEFKEARNLALQKYKNNQFKTLNSLQQKK